MEKNVSAKMKDFTNDLFTLKDLTEEFLNKKKNYKFIVCDENGNEIDFCNGFFKHVYNNITEDDARMIQRLTVRSLWVCGHYDKIVIYKEV